MAKQGLNKIWIFKDQIGLKLGEPVEREMEEQRREEEEKKKKKGRSSSKAPLRYGTWIFGMELLTLCMDPWFCWLMVYPKT